MKNLFFLILTVLVVCAVLLRRRAKTYTVKQVAIQEHGIILFGLCMCAHIFLKDSTAGAVAAVFGSFAFVGAQILNFSDNSINFFNFLAIYHSIML